MRYFYNKIYNYTELDSFISERLFALHRTVSEQPTAATRASWTWTSAACSRIPMTTDMATVAGADADIDVELSGIECGRWRAGKSKSMS